MRLITVVLGAPSNQQRFAQAAKLMEWAFDHYTAVPLLKAGQPLPVQVQVESGRIIQPIAARDVKVVLPKDEANSLRLDYRVPSTMSGPIKSGEQIGLVIVHGRDGVVSEAGALSPISVSLPGDRYAHDGWEAAKPTAYNQTNQIQENQ